MSVQITSKDMDRCRACLTMVGNFISLFDTKVVVDGHIKSWAEIIQNFCDLQINVYDKKPQKICMDCTSTVRTILSFKLKCQQSDQILSQIVEDQCKNKNNLIVEQIKHDEKSKILAEKNYLDNNSKIARTTPDTKEITKQVIKIKPLMDIPLIKKPINDLSIKPKTLTESKPDNIIGIINEALKDQKVSKAVILKKYLIDSKKIRRPSKKHNFPYSNHPFRYEPDDANIDSKSLEVKESVLINRNDSKINGSNEFGQNLNSCTENFLEAQSEVPIKATQSTDNLNLDEIKVQVLADHDYLTSGNNEVPEEIINLDDTNLDDEIFKDGILFEELENSFGNVLEESVLDPINTNLDEASVDSIDAIINFYNDDNYDSSLISSSDENTNNVTDSDNRVKTPPLPETKKKKKNRAKERYKTLFPLFKIRLEPSSNAVKKSKPTRRKCEFCDFTTDKIWTLVNHRRDVHSDKKRFTCNICNQNFFFKYILKQHLRKHDNRKYMCEICGKVYLASNALHIHKKTHLEVRERPFGCTICGKRFTSNMRLKVHFVRHENVRPFICEICGTTFKRNNSLLRHIKAHNQGRPFVCNICGKTYTTKFTMEAHRSTHGNGKYHCDICDMGFYSPGLLKVHKEKKHTSVKLFNCEICDKNFKYKTQLKSHMYVHTGEKPHICLVCGKGFSQKISVKVHMKNVHFKIPDVKVEAVEAPTESEELENAIFGITSNQKIDFDFNTLQAR